ncbi:MAG: hypothetical protein PF437_05170 [Sulfurimonas sp.]|jgi:chemotaxis protein histidine kinase CheA|nr:hypothetical protein [Sulfurimonas sp.]
MLKSIDINLGLEQLRGNTKLYIKILKDFYTNYSDFSFDGLQQNECTRAIHILKGLSANIGAKTLHKIVKELDDYQDKKKLELLSIELKKVIDDLHKINEIDENKDEEKKEISEERVNELFAELREAAQTKRPKNCELVVNELLISKLNSEDKKLFESVNKFIKRYKFKDAIEALKDR